MIHENSAGLDPAAAGLLPAGGGQEPSPLSLALRHERRELVPSGMDAHGISVRSEEHLGSGRTWIVCLQGVGSETLL